MYEIERTNIFIKWLHTLKDHDAQSHIRARIERARNGNFGDWKTVGDGVCEMRIDCGGGYRVYYTVREQKIIFLLSGGGKNTQQADIKKAISLVKVV